MGRGEHMPEATTCPGSQPCHPPGQPGGLLLFPQLPMGRLPYPSTAQGCCPHQLVQVRKLLPAPKADRAERTSPGPSWQSVAKGKRMLFWDVTSGESPWWVLRVYFSGWVSSEQKSSSRTRHSNLRLKAAHVTQRTSSPLTRISISMVLQVGNTNVINSLTHIKPKWGSLSISDGSPKAGRVLEAIPEAGSVLRRTPCQPRAQPPWGNTIHRYHTGKMSIFNQHSLINLLFKTKIILLLTYSFFLSLF